MNREDIIRMAKEAGAFFDGDCSVYDMPEHCFERFAALVAAAERDAVRNIILDYAGRDDLSDSDESLLKHLFELIRARGET